MGPKKNFAGRIGRRGKKTVSNGPKETLEQFLARGGQIQYPPVGQIGKDPELDTVEV